MPTQKIADLPTPCSHPEHNPPSLKVFKPGVYDHTCPACGLKQPFVVERLHWVATPLGTRAHSSSGGYWERVQSGWRAQSGCVFPTPGGDATQVSFPDNPELRISRAAQPEPPPTGDGAEVLPMVIADLQARSEIGRAKYGTTLRVNNGRDALMDAYQESLDQVMYLRQRIEEDRLRAEAPCSHTETIRGANIPLRHGSCQSEVCRRCGAFRERDHRGNPRSSWQPASEYAEAIAEDDDDGER